MVKSNFQGKNINFNFVISSYISCIITFFKVKKVKKVTKKGDNDLSYICMNIPVAKIL